MSRTSRAEPGSLRIVVTGLIAQHPTLGGITWHYLQYVCGLALLGHDVYYVEDSGEGPYKLDGGPRGDDYVARDCRANISHLAGVASRFGFADRWAHHCPIDKKWYGLSDSRREALLREADLLINVSGTLSQLAPYRQVKRRAYVDTDPVVTQIKIARGGSFRTRVAEHDVHFSFGETLGDRVPATPQTWRATRQPVVLAEWEPLEYSRESYTTVMNWASYEPLRYNGHSYGQKDVEFRRYLELPKRMANVQFEVALSGIRQRQWETGGDGEPGFDDRPPQDLLRCAGWRVVAADRLCGDLDGYRSYIRSSRAEWSVAKNAYVVGRPGWFSERSAAYLAAGRPVVVQDTGFGSVIPTGAGVVSFEDMASAQHAVASVEENYAEHCLAARSLAESYFESSKVLSKLVAEAMDGRVTSQ